MKEGKYTLEEFAKENNLKKQSALNLLSKLKKQGYLTVSGGGKQKRIYTISKLKKQKTNGFYDIVNKYSPEKLTPKFRHVTSGIYNVENAIIDGIKIKDIRTQKATMHLFRHVKDWKKLIKLAEKHKIKNKLMKLYFKARKTTKTKRIPKRYLK